MEHTQRNPMGRLVSTWRQHPQIVVSRFCPKLLAFFVTPQHSRSYVHQFPAGGLFQQLPVVSIIFVITGKFFACLLQHIRAPGPIIGIALLARTLLMHRLSCVDDFVALLLLPHFSPGGCLLVRINNCACYTDPSHLILVTEVGIEGMETTVSVVRVVGHPGQLQILWLLHFTNPFALAVFTNPSHRGPSALASSTAMYSPLLCPHLRE